MKKLIPIVVIIIVLIIIFVGRWQLDVGSDCTLESNIEESKVIYAQTPGLLSSFNYRSGDTVEKGALLGHMTDLELQDNLEQVQASLKEAEAQELVLKRQIQEKEQAIVSASLKHQKAQVESNQVSTDVQSFNYGKIPPEIDISKIKADEAKRQYEKLAKEQEKMKKSGEYPPAIEALAQKVEESKVKLENQEFVLSKNRYLSTVGAIPKLDYENIRAEYEMAKRMYNNAKANLEDAIQKHYYDTFDAKDAYENAQNDYDVKLKDFFLKNDQLNFDTQIAGSEVQQTVLGQDTYKAQLQENEEKIIALKQKQAIYLDKEKKLTLIAPISGILIEDDIINKLGKQFELGEKICEVAGLRKVLVNILVDEKDIGDVRLHQPVRLKVKPFLGSLFQGEVSKISPASKYEETKKRNFYSVELLVDNPDGKLKPGMTGFAKINCGSAPIFMLIFREIGHLIRSEYWFF